MAPVVGLVLSGGGARGAYEVGVLRGLAEALDLSADGGPLFRVVSGTSVGAINGAWLVAHAHRADHHVEGLTDAWRGLVLREHLRVDLLGLMSWLSPFRFFRQTGAEEDKLGRSVLDPSGLERLVGRAIDWNRLHANVDAGLVRAFTVAALHVGTGVTALFTELAPGVEFRPTRHPRRIVRPARIGAEHVLASAAIPALFPARRIGASHFVDGGLRLNTPIAPALRTGAEKLVVISLRHEAVTPPPIDSPEGEEAYPHPVFLAGKLLNALLLDPVAYDLQVLEGLNRIMEVLDTTLTPAERARFDAVLVETRGMSYRTVETLTFEPSEDIARLAGEHVRAHLGRWQLGRFYEWLLERASRRDATWESDLASYLLFDGLWAETLMALGRRDALARRDEVRAFFAR
jgi:NTE family protein